MKDIRLSSDYHLTQRVSFKPCLTFGEQQE